MYCLHSQYTKMAGHGNPFTTFPATLLLTLLVSRLLHHSAAAHSLPIPANSPDLDEWIAENIKAFEIRTKEIENAVDVNLETQVVKAEQNRRVITVRKDGSGDFLTITEAVNSIPSGNSRRVIVSIGPGIYTEKVTVDRFKPFVTFLGDEKAMPTITFNGTAAQYGTWLSATVAVDSHYFMASKIIFQNSAPMPPPGAADGQAVAMRISGDKAAFYNCKFIGYQDTLCDDKGRHFFKNCFIQGTVDFIFGNGRSLYLNCTINSVWTTGGVTAITAQGRLTKSDKSGFSFVHCVISGSGKAYLSRAWRGSSRVVFAYTYMATLVYPQGWDDKGFADRQQTVFYGEYKCMGPGSNLRQRVSYGRVLNNGQAKPFLSMTFIRARTWLLPPPTL